MKSTRFLAFVLALVVAAPIASALAQGMPVTIENFVRAETDLYFGRMVREKGLGKLGGTREVTPIEKQDVVRMNRDTIYLSGVFDLDAAPVLITLPDAGKRFMSMQVISQDHYTVEVTYTAGAHTYSKDAVGTRYAFAIVRMLVNPADPADVKTANALLDAIKVEQATIGHWEEPKWDEESRGKIRAALEQLNAVKGDTNGEMFGRKGEVDPVLYLLGAAVGWGGNPRSAAIYLSTHPKQNDGLTPYVLTVKDVPVDGFWSISVYNAKGYFERNARDAYSINNLTARPNPDGSISVQFGGEQKLPNYLPVTPGWNYTVRLYRPRPELLTGAWRFPAAEPL